MAIIFVDLSARILKFEIAAAEEELNVTNLESQGGNLC